MADDIQFGRSKYKLDAPKTLKDKLAIYYTLPAWKKDIAELDPLIRELDGLAGVVCIPYPMAFGIKYLIALYNWRTHCKAFEGESTCRTMYNGFGMAGAKLPYHFLNTESELFHCIKPKGLNFTNTEYHRCERDWFVMNICTELQWKLIEMTS